MFADTNRIELNVEAKEFYDQKDLYFYSITVDVTLILLFMSTHRKI